MPSAHKQHHSPSDGVNQHMEKSSLDRRTSHGEGWASRAKCQEGAGGAPASPEKASIRGSGFHINNQLALSVEESWTGPGESCGHQKCFQRWGKNRFMAFRAATSIHVVGESSSGSRTSLVSHGLLHPEGLS